jgi:hypothetical protein
MPGKWTQSKEVLNSLENTLFSSTVIAISEAKKYYEKFYMLIKNNKLAISTISLYEQRLLSYLLFPTPENESNYLIKLENCWSQMRLIILKRFDTQCIEILCNKVSQCNVNLVPNIEKVISNLESIITSSKTFRLQKTRRLLTIELDANQMNMSWLDSILKRSNQKELYVLKAFEQYSKAEYSNTITDKSLFLSRNCFWEYYFKQGLVKKSRLLVSAQNRSKVQVYSQKIIELTGSTINDFAIMFHVGNRIIIEWANPGSFLSFEESDKFSPDFFTESIDQSQFKNAHITKHRANNYNYWQYLIGLSLRASTGVRPSKADYEIVNT